MQAYKRNYLQHAFAVSHWMHARGAEGGIDPLSHILEVRCNGRTKRFQPQFVIELADGGVGYAPHLVPDVSGFVGWLPYYGKAWPEAQDKLAFKAHAAKAGLRTPLWTTTPSEARGTYIVKARRASLGRGLRGPFDAPHVETLARRGEHVDEYCEQFVIGRLLKALYWNDRLVVAEIVDMPTVRGDGKASLRELTIERAGVAHTRMATFESLMAVQGLNLDSVMVPNEVAVIEYRWVSPLNPAITQDCDMKRRIVDTPLEQQLSDAGRACLAAVPEDRRANTALSLDGVIDRGRQIWFLEANCNPQLHPSFYSSMLDDIFFDERR